MATPADLDLSRNRQGAVIRGIAHPLCHYGIVLTNMLGERDGVPPASAGLRRSPPFPQRGLGKSVFY